MGSLMFSVFKIRSCADNDPAVLEVLVRKIKKDRHPNWKERTAAVKEAEAGIAVLFLIL